MRIIARRVWRIGVLTLWQADNGRFFVSCQNRTYRKTHEVPPEKLARWRRLVETGK